ncbi:MAG: divergent polysaccharide deacetylase family protein, partial [Xanthobacteraceae bacterium]
SGLGVSAAQTAEAIRRLPAAVTLGFAPYGAEVRKWTAEARTAGHEILLQVPMEPFDYPDNDPGPQTLLTSSSATQNLDRLHWHMSRFAGYVGLTPFMGARLAADDAAMQTVIADAARRGLGYFDDGRAARSVAARLAETAALPFARADLVIDRANAAGDIDAALADLERLARERGTAIGAATLAPVTIDRIAAWAATLADRGIALVPLTTAMLKSKSS